LHREGLDGAFFSDLQSIREPVMVQEVYVLDPFLRALGEFRSPQSLGDEAVPVPCHDDESCVNIKLRLFEQIRANFEALRSLPRDIVEALYAPATEPHDDDEFVRPYDWSRTYFAEGWSESKLEGRYSYDRYSDYLDASKWCLYEPDMVRCVSMERNDGMGRPLVRQAKNRVSDYKQIHKVKREVRHRDAILFMPTHVRVRLVRSGFGRIPYLVPRVTTFEALQKRVAADVGQSFAEFGCGGGAENKFGPGKRLAGVVRLNCGFVQHAWKGVMDAADVGERPPPKRVSWSTPPGNNASAAFRWCRGRPKELPGARTNVVLLVSTNYTDARGSSPRSPPPRQEEHGERGPRLPVPEAGPKRPPAQRRERVEDEEEGPGALDRHDRAPLGVRAPAAPLQRVGVPRGERGRRVPRRAADRRALEAGHRHCCTQARCARVYPWCEGRRGYPWSRCEGCGTWCNEQHN